MRVDQQRKIMAHMSGEEISFFTSGERYFTLGKRYLY